MTHQWYAVRCCCEGNRLLGFIRLPEGPESHRVPERTTTSAAFSVYSEQKNFSMHIIRLKMFGNERAVYSDDKPIEFWRSINGFVEAK